ncbi:hypothetical protein BZA77DRAFT_328835 [Pyronema omphalodes]|nr:hypothetical protein BZA77DRAFT_328835 [Pyronema omphalodes]
MPPRTDIPTNYQDPEVATGTSILPRSRIMKIIKTDEDIYQCNKQATHLVQVATEMFIQYLSEQGVRSLAAERKQRKTVQYKDFANAVARIDNLEFLSDVIPQQLAAQKQTTEKETKAGKSKKKDSATIGGQKTLSSMLKPKAVAEEKEKERDPASDDDDTDGEEKQGSGKGKEKQISGQGKEKETEDDSDGFEPLKASEDEDEDVVMG